MDQARAVAGTPGPRLGSARPREDRVLRGKGALPNALVKPRRPRVYYECPRGSSAPLGRRSRTASASRSQDLPRQVRAGSYIRAQSGSTTRITHRLDPSRAPHVRLWAQRGLDNPLARRVGEGASCESGTHSESTQLSAARSPEGPPMFPIKPT